MDVFPKFIIEGNALIIRKATYHKDIATNPADVKGGGWFRYSDKTNTFTFYGQSEDFGPATKEMIAECIKDGWVYNGHKGSGRNISQDYKFAYDTGSEVLPFIRPVKLRALAVGDEFRFVDHFSDNYHKVIERVKPGPDSTLVYVEKPSGMKDYYDKNTLVQLKSDNDEQ